MKDVKKFLKLSVPNEENIKKIDNCISLLITKFGDLCRPCDATKKTLFHYTSFDKLFKILDGDSFWASKSRFSNDSTEDKILGEEWLNKEQYYGDNYIVCFCGDGDILSQWRGYCPQGGASVELDLSAAHTYTVLNSDYDDGLVSKSKKIQTFKNKPLPVIYCCSENEGCPSGIDAKEDLSLFWKDSTIDLQGLEIKDIVPYLKNSYFKDELEYRLVFDNSDGALEDCVRFRELEDGSRTPYMIVKYGDIANSGHKLSCTYTQAVIKDLVENYKRKTIVIPCGIDQAEICRMFNEELQEKKQNIYKSSLDEESKKNEINRLPKIICDGHLPIVSITISPSPKQEYMREAVERFCRSRYWLRHVEVKCSPIPYIAPKI